MRKKIIAVIIIAFLVVPIVSCAKPSNKDVNEIPTEAITPDISDITNIESSVIEGPDLPDVRYDGYELVILHRFSDRSSSYYCEYWINAEIVNGDIINDGIFKRNSMVTDKYGARIKSVENSNPAEVMNTSTLAGLYEYDVMFDSYVNTAGSVIKGTLTDLNTMPYINFTASYWDGNCAVQTSIMGKLYGMVSDISLMTLSAARAIIFNRDLIDLYLLENPYELVASDSWNIEKMAEMIQGVSCDLNGDGVFNDADQYGMLTETTGGTSNISMFITSSGIKLTTNDENGIPQPSFLNEKAADVIEKWRTVLINQSTCYDYSALNSSMGRWAYGRQLFSTDHFLFMQGAAMLFDELNSMNMESEYGIVPNPKYDKSQESYYHRPDRYATMLSIPITNQDKERTGIIIESLAYYSHLYVLPEYYETTIKLKRARVPELGDMMDIIRGSICYEMSDMYSIDTVTCINGAFLTGNISSTFKASEKVIVAKIKNVVGIIEKLP